MNLVMGIGFLGSLALGIVLSQHLIRRIRKIKELAEQLEKEILRTAFPMMEQMNLDKWQLSLK